MEIDASSPFSKAFDHASSQIGLRFQNPLYQLTELFTGADFRSSLIEVKRFGRQIVSEARKRRARVAFESLIVNEDASALKGDDSGAAGFGSLIDSLIEALAKPTVVADAALNFLSAGRDTTAQSFTWTLYALMRHPAALRRVRDEIDSRFPDHSGPLEDRHVEIDVATLQPANLPYTLAAFYESLRLYPPVPFEIKQTTTPVTLPDGTSLPAGAIVIWCIYALNRSLSTFGADALEFRPERWLDSDGRFIGKYRGAGEFPVFNGGPRACLGRKMAEVMACWVLMKVLREWDFDEVRDGEGNKERISANSLTLPMEGGLPCRVKVRERKVAR